MNSQKHKKSVIKEYKAAINTIAKFSGLSVSEIAARLDNRNSNI